MHLYSLAAPLVLAATLACAPRPLEPVASSLLETGAATVAIPTRSAASRLLSAVVRADETLVIQILAEHPCAATAALTADEQVSAPSGPGRALSVCAKFNELAIARLLLQAGADANAKDCRGKIPLHHVSTPEMVQLLLEGGANLKIMGPKGESPISNIWSLRSKLGKATAEALIEAGVTLALEDAIRLGRTADVRRIVAASGASPTTADLYRAVEHAENGDLDVLKALLDAGAPVDGPPPKSRYMNWWYPEPISLWATHKRKPGAAHLLIDRGAALPPMDAAGCEAVRGINLINGKEGDVLDQAIDLDHADLARQLLVAGFSPERCEEGAAWSGPSREIRLARAAWRGSRSVIEVLLEHGASLEAAEGECSPVLIAAAAGRPALHDALVAAHAPVSVHALAALGRAEQLKDVLVSDNCNERDGRLQFTPLAWAVVAGMPAAIDVLIAHGADPNIEVPRVWTPTWPWETGPLSIMPRSTMGSEAGQVQLQSITSIAVERRRLDIARTLLRAGTKPNATLLTALVGSDEPGATALLKEVLERTATPFPDGWADHAIARVCRRQRDWYAFEDKITDVEARTRLQLLLSAGPDLMGDRGTALIDRLLNEVRSDEFITMLFDAGAKASFDAACVLNRPEHGATNEALTALDTEAREALIWKAIRAERADAIERILETAGDDRAHHAEKTAKRAAWSRGPVVESLIQQGVIDVETEEKAVELMSKQMHSPDLIARFLASDVLAELNDTTKRRLLNHACQHKKAAPIRLLLEAGADPNLRTDGGKATLEILLNGGERSAELVECVRLLLEAGANPMKAAYSNPMLFEYAHFEDLSEETLNAIDALMRPYVGRYMD